MGRYRDTEFLRGADVEQGRSASEIAADCSVSASAVSRWLDHHSIERAPRYKEEVWLREQDVERGRRQQDIAEDCVVTTVTICHWLSRHGITDDAPYE